MIDPTRRDCVIRLPLAALLAAAVPTPAFAQAGGAGAYQGYDWPNRHGTAYDNISRETGWIANWPASGPKIAWEKKVGIGFASVSVDKGLLYTMGNDSNRETIYCLDTESGKVMWRHTYPAKLLPKLHEGGPTCTPTVADGRVFTLGKEGQVHCLEAETGQVVWQADLKKILRIKTPEWGFASSPLILGNQVIFQAGATISFDKNSGRQKWKSRAYPAAYTTPQPFTLNDTPGLAVLNSTGLVILDPSSGGELSHYPWKTQYNTNATTPMVFGDTVFLSTGYKKGCALLKLGKGELKPLYANKVMSNHMNNSVRAGDFLYGFDGNSHRNKLVDLVCMDLKTGKEAWRRRGLGCGSLLASDGKLIILSDRGVLVTAQATSAGYREIARAQVLGGKCWTVPVLAQGRVYCRNAKGDLVCVDLRPG